MVFDTYAWVEYISGGTHANKIADLLANPAHGQKKVTPATVMAELTERLLREGVDQLKIEQVISFIASRTLIYPCDSEVAFHAGRIDFEQKKKVKDWGMFDSLNYAIARMLNCSFVTGDPHFKGKKDVIFLA